MSVSLTMNADKKVWYKEPWPWILMALPATAVVAGIITLLLAIRSNDGLVADDYYKQGLGINKVLARQEMAAKMGLKARVDLSGSKVVLQLSGREGMALPEKLRFSLSHPTKAGEDEGVVLTREGERYVGSLKLPAEGHWNVMVEDVANTWRMSSTVVLPLKAAMEMLPVDAKPVD